MKLWFTVLICLLAGAGAGIGTGFAGMSAAAVIGPVLATFLDVPAYEAVGIGLICEITAVVCHDSGNDSLGKMLQIIGSAVILWLSLPVFRALIDLIQSILGEL